MKKIILIVSIIFCVTLITCGCTTDNSSIPEEIDLSRSITSTESEGYFNDDSKEVLERIFSILYIDLCFNWDEVKSFDADMDSNTAATVFLLHGEGLYPFFISEDINSIESEEVHKSLFSEEDCFPGCCYKANKDTVDWILENILNCHVSYTENEISRVGENQCYVDDSFYYASIVPGGLEGVFHASVENVETVNKDQLIYDVCGTIYEKYEEDKTYETPFTSRIQAKEIDGYTFWSIQSFIPMIRPDYEITDYIVTLKESRNLRIRESTSTESKKIGVIPNGTTVEVYETCENWGKIEYKGTSGWIDLNCCSPLEISMAWISSWDDQYFHLPSCDIITNDPSKYIVYISDAFADGYEPCPDCLSDFDFDE